jgi:hypothetical protein
VDGVHGPQFGFHAFERGTDGSRVRDVRTDGDDLAAVGADTMRRGVEIVARQ